MTNNITVKIDGTDITSQVRYPTLDTLSRSFSDSDRCTMEVSSLDNISLSPLTECEVIDGDKIIFGGTLSNHRITTDSINKTYSLEFTDWSEKLRTVTIIRERYANVPITYILLNLFSKYAPEFQVIIDDSRTVGEIVFKQQSLMEAVEELQDDFRLDWFITPDKTIYLFKELKDLS